MANECDVLVVSPHRNGGNLNIMVGAKMNSNPAILTWILVSQNGGTGFYYPEDFEVGGQYVYPGLVQSKLFIPIGDGPYSVKVYAANSDCIGEFKSE